MSDKNTKIVFFLHALNIGGLHKVIINLANELAARDYRVEVCLMERGGLYHERVLSPRITTVTLGAPNFLKALPKMCLYLLRTRPDILFTGGIYQNAICALAKRITFVKTRVFISIHTPFIPRPKKWTKKALWTEFYYFVCRFSDGIVAVSEGLRNETEEKCLGGKNSQVHIIHNPVFEPHMLEMAKEPVSHPWFREGETVPVILYVGRLFQRQKNLIGLLESFALLRETHAARLFILGEGNDRSSIAAKVDELGLRDVVDMPGADQNPFKYMARAHMLVLFSQYEGLPTTLIEAMSVGCQVISTDCTYGPNEILEQGKYGKLVPVGDQKALRDSMVAVLEGDRIPPQTLMTRGQSYSFVRAADKYVELFFGQQQSSSYSRGLEGESE